MIEEPPLIRIRTAGSRNRPDAARIAAFQGVQTGHLCDAMDGAGALDSAIKPLPGVPHTLCGPALTAHSGPADILGLVSALSEVAPGDVIVNAFGGHQQCAAVGDLVTTMARNAGAAGIVTDGPGRDIAGIRKVGLPVFATGLTPNSPFGKGPCTVGHPVHIGGRRVGSGDMIVGDEDGVVVVPFEMIDDVLARLDAVRAAEAELEAKVNAGLAVPPDIADLVISDSALRT